MELPSMVQRSGDTLIVRSVVSGNQLYMDQGSGSSAAANNSINSTSSTIALEQQLERYCMQQQQQQQQQQQHYQLQQQQQHNNSAAAQMAMELKDENLPQCKIKRNYSCSYCPYFTQNPRYHLTHLRDVHNEKIVINKCKLCLYASRHFQKLVRHMKMVHGCTEGIPGQHGQTRKRGMNRDARKRKLEQTVEGVGGGLGTAGHLEMTSLEQVKRELQLQNQQLRRDVLAFNKQQQEEKQRQQQQQQQQELSQSAAEAIFVAAYERQLKAQRERDYEAAIQHQSRVAATGAATYEPDVTITAELSRNTPPTPAAHSTTTAANANASSSSSTFQMPHHQVSNKNLDITTSPSTSPIAALSITSASYPDEAPQNRLLKCSVCEFTTLYRAQLVDHEEEKHDKTKFFRCEKCSYVTHIKARFSKHVKYHSMPMIKCVTCDFRTPYKWNLDRHMKNHGGAGPFKCAACDFTADIKQSLTVHEMNHHVPPVGHAAGMSLARRRNKVGGTDLSDDFLSDSADLLDDQYNNNNLDDYEEALVEAEAYGKRGKYEEDEPTDLSQKGGSSDTSSVHNQSLNGMATKAKRPVPNLIPIPKMGNSVLNLSKDFVTSRSSLTEIASMFFNDKQLSEMLQPLDKTDAAQLSPSTTITSTSSQHSRSILQKKLPPGGSFFDKLKSSAIAPGGPNENLICPCGHMAKCLSESIIHRKSCNFAAITDDDIEEEEEQDDIDGRLEIDFDEDDKQSHSALNLSVTGSTRCQHCRHRCKSSADLLNHLKQCTEAGRCGNDSYDSLSGESSAERLELGIGEQHHHHHHHPMENRVFVWNKMPSDSIGSAENKANDMLLSGGNSSANSGQIANGPNDENSYYGVETAPGYGEVTKKMTPEEEAANSSLKKVYKCPECSFWASTASRFHVHIVGHLNKKPFECSLCSYRSNWRWDITKHIRLKTIRDPSHKKAHVLMNDETGRRNYTKYNKYITLMKVTDEDGDPKLMKSGEMTPNQVASLAFVNFNKNASVAGSSTITLNGIKDDVTLEPISTSKSNQTAAESCENQIPESFMRLPFIASAMMSAAMAQQKQEQDQPHVTLITPSVTISAVKRSPPPPNMKPSDDLVTDVKQEGNEKKTFYKCRKCNFRHSNRDAVLAHVKIHYQDYPIVTATATSSPSSSKSLQQHSTPLQVAVNSNLYMNNVFAAMCLSQQQQQQQQTPTTSNTANSMATSPNSKQVQQQHSILSAGLLQQAIQGNTNTTITNSPNSSLSGLALALAGKSPAKGAAAATSILEHGEQNASQNEASSSLQATGMSTGALSITPSSTSFLSTCPTSSLVRVHPQTSLQHLLTSPRSSNSNGGVAATTTHLLHSPLGGSCSNNKNNNNNNNYINNNMVMGFTTTATTPPTTSPNSRTTTTTASSAGTICSPTSSSSLLSNTSPSSPISSINATSTTTAAATATAIVTTLPTANSTTLSTSNSSLYHKNIKNSQMGLIGASLFTSSSSLSCTNNNNNNTQNIDVEVGANGVCIGGVHGSNNSSTTTTTTTTPSTSCNLLLNTATTNAANATTTTNININSNNLLTNDNERRDPSPYRCGHCHQVSNWKHVIQRHCRLKHAGDIRIETLDRATGSERTNAQPTYRPLGPSNENNNNTFGITLKALQQQQQQQQQQNTNVSSSNNNNNCSNNNNNNNNVLTNKTMLAADHLLQSATNHSSHEIQAAAAAAYLAAAYKAATSNASNSGGGVTQNTAEDMLLHQQLQQNEQIEITRLPSNSTGNNNNTASSLAQLLESSASSLHSQQNSKCKQQKCPLCPYISESKSQMNYHISLHKPTQYECSLCTFVCAKKQHLSSHMRSVHHHHHQHTANGSGLPLDFSVALQLAAAAQAQQDSTTSTLAMDLTSLKSLSAAANYSNILQKQQQHHHHHHQQSQQISNEFQLFKIVSYCSKCPARFPQKLHDTLNTNDFQDHLKAHTPALQVGSSTSTNLSPYKCEFCDFMAPHETLLQAHRFVHSIKYQEKCNELIRNCKEDPEHPAPKLMQITLNKNSTQSEIIWVVDNKFGEQLKDKQQQQQQQQQQHANISSSSTHFDNTNSLLKKQLESGPAPLLARNSPSPKESSSAPSTSASVATSDLAADAGSESGSVAAAASPGPIEKCQHCPYETTNASQYKSHLQHHICISNVREEHNCEHCDYTDQDEHEIIEHTGLHFNAMEKLKSVAFFTSYDSLELSVEHENDSGASDDKMQEAETLAEMGEGNDQQQEQRHHHIKQEHNNNNEENAINENIALLEITKPNEKALETTTCKDKDKFATPAVAATAAATTATTTIDPAKKTCTKIILYKNDGCLSIKKDISSTTLGGNSNSNSSSVGATAHNHNERDNISDRLRRRIRSSSNSHLNGGGGGGINDEQQSQQQSHKTILVNAKTGQVISRN